MTTEDGSSGATAIELREGDLPAGAVLGEYRVCGLIGRGGMGAVYRADQPEIGAQVAIKVLALELSRDPGLTRRFVEEARAVNRIRHPNIIDIFAFGRLDDGRQYFVMEYLEGETLEARLRRGPLPAGDARHLLLQICEALQAAHDERIIHRDLKPENLWIARPKHGEPYAKILDFGIAKLVETSDAPAITGSDKTVGTPHYMSPEQCRGEGVDHRTDLYALGVILYEMFAGRRPFDGPSYAAVIAQNMTVDPVRPSLVRPMPAALERVILACLEKDPARRPPSARALAERLDDALDEALPATTLAQAATIIPARRTPRRPWLIAGAVVAVLALAAGGVHLLRRRRPPDAAAYDAYLRGRYFFDKKTRADSQRALQYFEQAVKLDPAFAAAWSGVADVYATMQMNSNGVPSDVGTRAKAAALRALELDDGLADAHVSLAYILLNYDWDWAGAERHYRRALALDPDHVEAHRRYGMDYLASIGRFDDAIRELETARRLAPFSIPVNMFLGNTYYMAGRFDQAVAQLQRTIELDPHAFAPHLMLANAYAVMGRAQEAIAEFDLLDKDMAPLVTEHRAYALARAGRTAEAIVILDRHIQESTTRYVEAALLSRIEVALGRRDEAFSWLERAVRSRSFWIVFLKVDPAWAPLRGDPRFADLVRRVGIP